MHPHHHHHPHHLHQQQQQHHHHHQVATPPHPSRVPRGGGGPGLVSSSGGGSSGPPTSGGGGGASPYAPPGAIPPSLVTAADLLPPCNTLFLGNLSDRVSEAELDGLLRPLDGFLRLKLERRPRAVSCFVEFTSVAAAVAARSALGDRRTTLASSDRGPLRVQFSRAAFGAVQKAAAAAAGGGAGAAGGAG
jgi:hypothetical protein